MSSLYIDTLSGKLSYYEFLEDICRDGYSIDGYIDRFIDGYIDGYVDGYADSRYDVDEICMSSDKIRYILDSGVEDSRGRISIFKDGKGFLNFRIFGFHRCPVDY